MRKIILAEFISLDGVIKAQAQNPAAARLRGSLRIATLFLQRPYKRG